MIATKIYDYLKTVPRLDNIELYIGVAQPNRNYPYLVIVPSPTEVINAGGNGSFRHVIETDKVTVNIFDTSANKIKNWEEAVKDALDNQQIFPGCMSVVFTGKTYDYASQSVTGIVLNYTIMAMVKQNN